MVDLVQWMHDYNQSASKNEKIHFYGNDMQPYEANKIRLLEYYQTVNKETAKTYTNQLAHVTNETMLNNRTKDRSY